MANFTSAQLSSSTGKSYTSFKDIDYVFVFNGITPSTEITYNGTYTTINWYKFSDPTISISNQTYISPDDATGYTLIVDGNKTNIWVIDYQNYLPTSSKLLIDDIQNSACENVSLSINPKVPILYYKTPGGDSINIPRVFKLNYQTQKWTDKWNTVPAPSQEITLPTTSAIIVPAPLCNTYFTLSGDQFAEDLGIKYDSLIISQNEYSAVAVECHPTSTVLTRDAINEAERPENASDVKGSAPLEMSFSSNANLPVTEFYKWEILKDGASEPYISRNDQDLNNTFTEHGTYKVRLTVSNNNCSYIDSTITVTVAESAIYAPNVFTPNGDGKNDEFRVAYKSIISFEAWVFNRWGRQVYHWTDPQKGWDGNINGRKATPGPYFYVIKALGSDFDPASAPIGKTKLRLGEYLLKGDINLLRGTN